MRVLSAAFSVVIQGDISGMPVVTAPSGTRLTMGIDRDIPVQMEKVKLPVTPTPDPNGKKDDLVVVNIISKGLTLGSLLGNITARRNR
jgi:hypothetical protein